MNNKILLTGLVLASLASTTMAAGLDNTVDSTAAHYGAEAYGYTNTITATGRSAFAVGYKNTVSANNALAYGVENKAEGINSLVGGEYSKATGRNSVAIGSSAQALQDNTFAIGSQARANGEDALAFGNGAYAENTATVAIGKTVKATREGALAIGFNTEATARDAIAIGGNVKEPGDTLAAQKTTASGRQSIALGHKANSKGISGISIGTNAYSEGRGAVSIGSWSIASGDGATAVGGGFAKADRAVAVGSGNADGKESVSVGSYSRVYAEGAIGIGRNVFIDDSATDSVVIGSSSETITKKNVTAIGSNTYSEVENSVALGTMARADEVVSTSSANIAGKTYNFAGKTADGTVSIGGKIISGYETDRYGMPIFDDNGNMIPIVDKTVYRTITNVAAGRISDTSTDAVNGSQLHAVITEMESKNQNILTQTNHYTDTQVNKGVAKASALAGLKFLDYNPKDKWSFAASVGHYRNANAVAVGAAYQPNENTMVHGGITVDGEVAYNLGISFKTGGQKYINKYELQDQVKQLQSNNAELRQELNELRSMIEKK